MRINNKRSYTEYTVTTATTDFVIGFDDYDDTTKSAIVVTINGILVESIGYTVLRKSAQVVSITPAVVEGVVRLQRETAIDNVQHNFTAGALFTAKSVDENFQQILSSQQEVRDEFVFLQSNANSVFVAAKATLAEVRVALEDVAEFLTKGASIESLTVTMLPTTAIPNVIAGGTPNKRTFELQLPRGAKGEVGDVDVATFDVDVQTGDLLMYTSMRYAGATFTINDNRLEVTL